MSPAVQAFLWGLITFILVFFFFYLLRRAKLKDKDTLSDDSFWAKSWWPLDYMDWIFFGVAIVTGLALTVYFLLKNRPMSSKVPIWSSGMPVEGAPLLSPNLQSPPRVPPLSSERPVFSSPSLGQIPSPAAPVTPAVPVTPAAPAVPVTPAGEPNWGANL